MVAEIEVGLGLDGNEVDVGVRHFHAEHSLGDACAGQSGFLSQSHALGKELQRSVVFVREVKEVVDLLFGNDQRVARSHRVDVEKRKVLFIFRHFVAGDFACHDFAEYRSHDFF